MTDATKPAAADATAAATPAAKTKTIEVLTLKSVFGFMEHPYTHKKFDTDRVTQHEHDNWIQAQLDGGKLVHA